MANNTKIGDIHFDASTGKIHADLEHPHLADAQKAAGESRQAFRDSLTPDAFSEALKKSKLSAEEQAKVVEALKSGQLHHADAHFDLPDRELAKKLDGVYKAVEDKDVVQKFEAAAKDHAKVAGIKNEMEGALNKHLYTGKVDIKDIKGYAAEHEEAIKKAVEARIDLHKGTGMFGLVKKDGVGAALKHNLFNKDRKVQSAVRLALAGGGLYAVADGVMRSETMGEDGKPVARSAFNRGAEIGLGGLVAVGAALSGSRQMAQ